MMEQLLVLNIPPALEDQLVDYLLCIPGLAGFTSYHVRGHGEHRQMTIAEQVAGRRKRIQFELILSDVLVAQVLASLREQVGTDIYFWQQPVTASGYI